MNEITVDGLSDRIVEGLYVLDVEDGFADGGTTIETLEGMIVGAGVSVLDVDCEEGSNDLIRVG